MLGNTSAAHLTGLAFIYREIAVYNWVTPFIPAVFAFLINFIRETVEGMEDVEGDFRNNIITLPRKYDFKKSLYLINTFTLLLILFTFYPVIKNIYGMGYFAEVTIFDSVFQVYFMVRLKKDLSPFSLRRSSNILKTVMVFCLLEI